MKNDNTFLSIFLAGFLDGRGCFNESKSKKGFTQFKVKIADNENLNLITFEKIFNKFGIKSSRDKFNAIWITNRESVRRLLEIIIPFSILKKEELLDFQSKLYDYDLSFIKENNSPRIHK